MLHAIALSVVSMILLSKPAELPISGSIDTTLTTANRHIRQFAFDGNENTYFESQEILKNTDHFTFIFEQPVALKSLAVVTGRPDGKEPFDEGTLEVSTDGVVFSEVAKFGAGGTVTAALDGREVQWVRIKGSAEGSRRLLIREFSIMSNPEVVTFQYPIEIAVDTSDSPEMRGWTEEVARLCELWYPRLNRELKSEGYKPVSYVTLRMTKSYRGVAEAGGSQITGSTKFFKAHPDDAGAFIHETTHIIQRYHSRSNPGWLVEGLADYIRFFLFEPGKIGPINAANAHYNGGYRTSAAFLAFVTEKYDKQLISKLNTLMRESKYKDSAFEELTGKTLDELDIEWRETLAR